MTNKELKTVFSNIGMGVGFIVVYFILIAILLHWKSDFSDDGAVTVIVTVIKCVTCITGISIAFYFGFRSVEEYMKHKEKQPDTQNNASNNKGNMHENQDACLTANSVNYLYVVGGFAAAAGVTLLSTWLTSSSTLCPTARHILGVFAILLMAFGMYMIKITYKELPPKELILKLKSFARGAGFVFFISCLIITILF